MLVRVTHAALNFSDLLMIQDLYQLRPTRPFIPGQEIAGIVEETPAGASFSRGDRIASKVLWGGFAEYACVRLDMAIPAPDRLTMAQAAALPVCYSTALVALGHCSHADSDSTVLVHAAAGGVGLAAVEIAAARGAMVIGTAGTPERLAIAQNHGASMGVNYRHEKWFEEVRALTGGRGADIIVDPVGGKIGEDSLRCIARDGKLLVVGFSSGHIPKLAANRLLLKRASAVGVYWNHDQDAAMLGAVQAELGRLIASEKINPRVTVRCGLDSLPSALDDLANRRVVGKLVLYLGESEKPTHA